MSIPHARLNLLFAGATFLVTSSAMALGLGFDPATTPVVSPLTRQTAPEWQLAGKILAPNQTNGASGVQIAPGWILSAKHVVPNAPTAPWFFQNAFGSATFNQCFWAPTSAYVNGQQPDIVLCKLNSIIPTPAGFTFPTLVENPAALNPSAPPNLLSPGLGAFLAVGYGAPYPGQARYAWVDYLGLPYDNNFTPATTGISSAINYRAGGDSGSPVFWFAPNINTTALVSVTTGGGAIRIDTVFAPGTLNWIASTVASLSTDRVNTATAASYFGALTLSPPWLDYGSLSIDVSTVTSMGISWKTPGNYANLVKRYLVTVDAGTVNVKSQFASLNTSGTQTLSLVGLQTNTPYTLCVVPTGLGTAALGEAIAGPTGYDANSNFSRNCKQVTLTPSPDLVQGLTITAFTKNFAGVGPAPTYSAAWSAPTTPAGVQVTGYWVTESINGAQAQTTYTTSPSYSGGPLSHGDRACLSIAAVGAPATKGAQTQTSCVTLP